ncbi:DNA-3-methyladenine glycosylase II [Sulfitobacter noctilucae]|uniref:DNA-3-methyladenine glycosylase family protein n=1 Tax=Sulfitobacter noctilucae TaxID=1342302 RepID=UPI000ABDFD38|nr:DNA-3-methyladenine glycosylase 2 family protein [Sulfitobacter noctilucae]KIN61293.1 DNA-3-methyladenine glycosylase II [Sulfitobacter noctilucae]
MSDASHLIRTQDDLAEGAAWLARTEPRFAPVLAQTGPLPLRLKPGGFAGLLDIIISQQVSVASADAIRARLAQQGLRDEDAVRAAGDDGLRAAGLSRHKARYALLLANAEVEYEALQGLENTEVYDRLTALTGIGPWTAQIYIMFCLGRADMFPPGDLALQVAAQSLLGLKQRPKPDELAKLAADWTPWRSVAARALFAYYRILKNREGLG